MEFLKEHLGEELYAQVAERLKDTKIKLADLSSGAHIGAEKYRALETERDTLRSQLEEAGKQIDAFKSMDVEGIKKAAEEYKTAAKKAQEESEAKIKAIQFDHALEKALSGAKARDPKLFGPLLDREKLMLSASGITGLSEQLEPLRKSHPYLFEAAPEAENAAPEAHIPSGTRLFQPDAPSGGKANGFDFNFTPIKPIPKKE